MDLFKNFFLKKNKPIYIKSEKNDNICSICYEDIFPKKKYGILCYCEHLFCKECIEKWRHKSYLCPICRKKSKVLITSPYFINTDIKNSIVNNNKDRYQINLYTYVE